MSKTEDKFNPKGYLAVCSKMLELMYTKKISFGATFEFAEEDALMELANANPKQAEKMQKAWEHFKNVCDVKWWYDEGF